MVDVQKENGEECCGVVPVPWPFRRIVRPAERKWRDQDDFREERRSAILNLLVVFVGECKSRIIRPFTHHMVDVQKENGEECCGVVPVPWPFRRIVRPAERKWRDQDDFTPRCNVPLTKSEPHISHRFPNCIYPYYVHVLSGTSEVACRIWI